MSTCAELPQLGCCDETASSLHGIAVNPAPNNQIAFESGEQIRALVDRLRLLIAATSFPAANLVDVYTWDGVGELVPHSQVAFDASSPGQTRFRVLDNGRIYQIIASTDASFSAGFVAIHAGRVLWRDASVSMYPSCIADLDAENVCLATRVTTPVQLPLGSAWDYRVNATEMEILSPPMPPGATLGWSVRRRALRGDFGGGIPGSSVEASVPLCCDLAPLPP